MVVNSVGVFNLPEKEMIDITLVDSTKSPISKEY